MALDTVQPNEKYHRKKFLGAVKSLSILEQTSKQVEENPRDTRLLSELGQVFHNSPSFYLDMYDKDGRGNPRQWTGDMGVKSDLEQAKASYSQALRDYVGNNLEGILGDYKDRQLETLVKILPMVPQNALKLPKSQFEEAAELFQYKVRNKLGKSLNEFALIQGYLQRGNDDEFNDYIIGRLQEFESSKDPHDQFLTQSYLAGQIIPGYIEQTMKAYARQAEHDVEKTLYKTRTTGKGKKKKTEKIFQPDVVREFISKAYEKVKAEVKAVYSDRILSLAA